MFIWSCREVSDSNMYEAAQQECGVKNNDPIYNIIRLQKKKNLLHTCRNKENDYVLCVLTLSCVAADPPCTWPACFFPCSMSTMRIDFFNSVIIKSQL